MRSIGLHFRVALIVMIIAVLNSGCSHISSSETEPTIGELVMGVDYYDQAWESCSWGIGGTQYTQEINPEIVFDDPALQKKVQKSISMIPLDTDEAVTVYAWDILPALIKFEYLPEGWVPILACHFTNNIWGIYYADGSIDRSGVRDGTIDVYVAEEDGHIVFIYDI